METEEITEEPTLEERATMALATLTAEAPSAEEVLAGASFPAWMSQPWLSGLTDPSDPDFANCVIRAEAWLANR